MNSLTKIETNQQSKIKTTVAIKQKGRNKMEKWKNWEKNWIINTEKSNQRNKYE